VHDVFRDRASEMVLADRNYSIEALLVDRTKRSPYALAFGA
jgi:hypothetical protein